MALSRDETWAGMAYVAFVIDVCSRMIVGWHLATNMRTELVMTALGARDLAARHAPRRAHRTLGCRQYTAIRFTDRLDEIGARPSIGSIGDSYDNAMAESVIGLYKAECVRHEGPWRGVDDLELATMNWVWWFNNVRLHGQIGYIPPIEFEDNYYRQINSQPHPRLGELSLH